MNGFKTVIPDEAASVLLNYTRSLKPGPLFPNHEKSKKPITRQSMHLIFQKYKKATGLTDLSHRTLVRTGVFMFGKPQAPAE